MIRHRIILDGPKRAREIGVCADMDYDAYREDPSAFCREALTESHVDPDKHHKVEDLLTRWGYTWDHS